MFRPIRFILVVATCALLTLPVAALAAPAPWEKVDVTLHSEESGGMLLVSGELPQTASLPAEAELSVPAGSQIQWIGEILGGPPSADPELKYAKSTKDDVDLYRFTLTKSRVAQVEIPITDALVSDGTKYTASLKWTAAQAIPEVKVSVRVPPGAQVLQPSPGASLQADDSGYSFYTKTVKNVKAGDQLDLAFVYSAPAASTPAGSPAAAASSTAAPVILTLVAVVAAIAGVVAVRRKMALKPEARRHVPTAAQAEDAKARTLSKDVKPVAHSKRDANDGGQAEQSPGADASEPARGLSGAAKRNLVTMGIVGTLILGAFLVGWQAAKPKVTGDTISHAFSQGQPCSTAVISLAVPAGADPLDTANTLFAALKPVGGMNSATYNFKTSTIEAGFCESKASEAVVRDALMPTGLVAKGEANVSTGPAASPEAASGNQALAVDTSSGSFAPTQLTAKSGIPIEITFGRGSGCLSEVVFPDLKVRQSLEEGPVVVNLPALKPGSYSFACGMGMQRGTLVVQ